MNVALMRVSSEQQETNSQKIAIENYCQQNNIIIDKWIETKISGFKTKVSDREDLNLIKDMALNGEIDKLIIFNQDRLGRRLEVVAFISLLTEANVTIISVTEGILNGGQDTDGLLSSIKSWMSEMESKKMSNRITNGIKARMKNNPKSAQGICPFGYKIVNGNLEVDEKYRDIIIQMYKEFIIGGNSKAIEYLNSVNINRYKRIQSIISNPIYKGIRNNVYIEELKIVSNELWEEAIESMRARTKRKGENTLTNRTDNLYESLIYHQCTKDRITKMVLDYTIQTNADGTKIKVYCYKCYYCKENKLNNKKSYSVNKYNKILDEAIENKFKQICLKDELCLEQAKVKARKSFELHNKTIELEKDIKNKKKILEGMNDTLNKIFLGELKFDVQVMLDKITVVTDEINKLEIELKDTIDKEEEIKKKKDNEEQLLERFNSLYTIYKTTNDFQLRKGIIRQVVNQIIFNNEDMVIKIKHLN